MSKNIQPKLFILLKKDIGLKRHDIINLVAKSVAGFINESRQSSENTIENIHLRLSLDEIQWLNNEQLVDARWVSGEETLENLAFKGNFLKEIVATPVLDKKGDVVALTYGPTTSKEITSIISKLSKIL